LRTLAYHSYLREFLPLDDAHGLHAFAGMVVSFEVMRHSFWHLLRWGLNGDIGLLWRDQTGVTGLLSLLCTPLIAWPTLFPRLKKAMFFEWRKALHYLSIVWGICICFHAPASHIFFLIGIPVVVYLLDYLYGFARRIHSVPTLQMTRLGSNIEIVFENPPGFSSVGSGYVYLCLPWISRFQWHALSIMAQASKENHSAVCIAVVGDWTKKLHQVLAKPSVRPGWIYGPFPSPYSTAGNYDNLIAVASGIGITPALCILANLKDTRKVSVIWISRDPSLLEYYLNTVEFDSGAWTWIFYTGRSQLQVSKAMLRRNPRVRLCNGRPNLEVVIAGIVNNTESKMPMPSELVAKSQTFHHEIQSCCESDVNAVHNTFERALSTYSLKELFDLACVDADVAAEPVVDARQMNRAAFSMFLRQTFHVSESKMSDGAIDELFASMDIDGNGWVDYDEFAVTVRGLGLDVTKAGKPQLKHSMTMVDIREESSASIETEQALSSWQLLYCGGSEHVVKALKKIGKQYKIDFKVESFNW